jgi:hypothetical protein
MIHTNGRPTIADPRSDTILNGDTYMIIRFHFNAENETIAKGLSLEDAQAHCEREDTHGDGWFDGYTREDS